MLARELKQIALGNQDTFRRHKHPVTRGAQVSDDEKAALIGAPAQLHDVRGLATAAVDQDPPFEDVFVNVRRENEPHERGGDECERGCDRDLQGAQVKLSNT